MDVRVGVIGCSKTKLDHAAPARDIYCSRTFRAASAWVDKRMGAWVILSAKHGVVLPDTVLEPYDLCLDDLTPEERARWASACGTTLASMFGLDAIYTAILGAQYMPALRGFPFVEDYIGALRRRREARGMSGSRATVGIGVLYKALAAGQEL